MNRGKPARDAWTSGRPADRQAVRDALVDARTQRRTLAEVANWTPRTRGEVRRRLIAAAVREGDTETAAYLRTASDAEGYPAPPWWYADGLVDRERYPWDPPDLIARLEAIHAGRDETLERDPRQTPGGRRP